MTPSTAAAHGDGPAVPSDVLTPSEGWYLLAAYSLSARGERRVRTGDLADRLRVTPASATQMAAKLAEASLLEYEPYAGVDLAPRGAELAASLAWRQCVVASFFDRVLAHPVDGHTAYRIGFAVPDAGLRRLRDRIDQPRLETCRRVRPEVDACLAGHRVDG